MFLCPCRTVPQNMMIPSAQRLFKFHTWDGGSSYRCWFGTSLLRCVRTAAGMSGPQSLISHCFAAILACAVSTVVFNNDMTSSGFSAPKMAVPATMTLLPVRGRTAPRSKRLRAAAHIGVGKKRTRFCAYVDRLRAHAAVNLDVLLREALAQLGDLGNAALDEFLAAAACTASPRASGLMRAGVVP